LRVEPAGGTRRIHLSEPGRDDPTDRLRAWVSVVTAHLLGTQADFLPPHESPERVCRGGGVREGANATSVVPRGAPCVRTYRSVRDLYGMLNIDLYGGHSAPPGGSVVRGMRIRVADGPKSRVHGTGSLRHGCGPPRPQVKVSTLPMRVQVRRRPTVGGVEQVYVDRRVTASYGYVVREETFSGELRFGRPDCSAAASPGRHPHTRRHDRKHRYKRTSFQERAEVRGTPWNALLEMLVYRQSNAIHRLSPNVRCRNLPAGGPNMG
jgi:hypothetical protein